MKSLIAFFALSLIGLLVAQAQNATESSIRGPEISGPKIDSLGRQPEPVTAPSPVSGPTEALRRLKEQEKAMYEDDETPISSEDSARPSESVAPSRQPASSGGQFQDW